MTDGYTQEIIRLRKAIRAALIQLSLPTPDVVEARLELIDGLQAAPIEMPIKASSSCT